MPATVKSTPADSRDKPRLLRAILAGVSGRASWVLEHAKSENGFELVRLCDVNSEALEGAAVQAGLPKSACHRDLSDAIVCGDADCLIICAPTRFHVPMVLQGAEAGLAVLTEKGMAPDWESASSLVTRVSEIGTRFCVAQNYRYKPVELAISACLNGEVAECNPGTIGFGDLIHHRVRPDPRTLDYPFASVWDMSCHHFDNLLFWLGAPRALTALAFSAPWSKYPHPNNTAAVMEFRSGAQINYFHGHDSARSHFQMTLHGERGAIFSDDVSVEFSGRPDGNFGRLPVQSVLLPTLAAPEALVLRDFHRYVVEGAEPGISGRQNLEVMALCQMLCLSATEQRTVYREELE